MENEKILLIDDDKDFVQLVAVLLRSHEYIVDLVPSATKAFARLKYNPDLILLDFTLPGMDGVEFCRRIKKSERFSHIPIIFLTGRNSSEDTVQGLRGGADDYIVKPFKAEELFARLEAVLRRARIFRQGNEHSRNITDELKRIIENELITPFFQPIVSFRTFAPLGFEALSRPPQNSFLSNPEYLFKTAETSAMYLDLEKLCWRGAIAKWKAASCPMALFLNCNLRFIENGQLNCDLLMQQGVSPRRVVWELTERTAIHDHNIFHRRLEACRESGLRIAIDDVGAGFASLDMIAEIRPDFVKIDMPLIRRVNDDLLKQSIIKAIVSVCRENKIMCIAEGIETEEELRTLKDAGVDAGQGYFLARPAGEIDARRRWKGDHNG